VMFLQTFIINFSLGNMKLFIPQLVIESSAPVLAYRGRA
jgi:hypothetical protein